MSKEAKLNHRKNSEVTRLVLAKKLYLHGCAHANLKDQVSRMLAVHHFDNAVEMVLKCIATNLAVITSSKRDPGFKDLWDDIDKEGRTLPLKEQMFALRILRNIVQHQGDIPPLEAVLKYKAYTEDFFKDVSTSIFGVRYEELFLSALIEDEKLREKLCDAQKAFESADYRQCVILSDEAVVSATFEQADIIGTAGVLTRHWGASEEFIKVISSDYGERYREKDFYEFAKDMSRALVQLGQASTAMQFLGEHRADFLRHRRIIEALEHLTDEELKNAAEFSFDFAINLILKWQEEGMFGEE
jgi:hypothetical protein